MITPLEQGFELLENLPMSPLEPSRASTPFSGRVDSLRRARIIPLLTNPADPSTTPSFNVVAPSLPGYAWSTLPRSKDWSISDTARVFNKLMVDVLGYEKYIGQGGDWGSHILRYIAINYSTNMKLVHFNMFYSEPVGLASYAPYLKHIPFVPQGAVDSLSEWGLSEHEKNAYRRYKAFIENGSGYNVLQSTRPATIGYAISVSPLSLLGYIGEKILAWSDPNLVQTSDVIETVAIYYLTESFHTSVMIYQQRREEYFNWLTDTKNHGRIGKMAYGSFAYEPSSPPKSWIAKWGDLVQYTEHDTGGHFPALDCTDGLVADLHKFATNHWKE